MARASSELTQIGYATSASSVRQRPSASHPVGGTSGPPVGLRTPSHRESQGIFQPDPRGRLYFPSSLMEGAPQGDSVRYGLRIVALFCHSGYWAYFKELGSLSP